MTRVWRVIILLMRTKFFGPGWVKAIHFAVRINTVLSIEHIVVHMYQYEHWAEGGWNKPQEKQYSSNITLIIKCQDGTAVSIPLPVH